MKIKLFAIILFVGGLCPRLYAQESEHIVILWDVTGSLLPAEPGEKDLDGSTLPIYNSDSGKGNGMWVSLKKALIECIEYIEEDPGNKITIVTFHDHIREIFSQNASKKGKETLVNLVEKYKYKKHCYTNIVDPIKKFYTLLNGNQIKYMFLFTDGDNDQPETMNQLIPTLDAWTDKTKNKNAYGFYVLVHPDADKIDIRNSIDKQDNFWIVPDAKVRIKFCKLPSILKYNIRDEKGAKTINLQGNNYKDAKGKLHLLTSDEYYDVICSDSSIEDGTFKFEVKPKLGKKAPVKHDMILTPRILGSDEYTFIGPKEIYCEVSNLPERNLSLFVEENDWGNASYYEAFYKISKESYKPVVSNIKVKFSKQAFEEGSSAIMKIYLVDKQGEGKISLSSKGFKLFINEEEIKKDYYELLPNSSDISLSIVGLSKAEEGKYYGRIELEPTNLDNYSINGTQDVFKWKFEFDKRWNPFILGLTWLLGIFISAILIWMILLKPIFYPRFGSIQKTFNAPGMAPLIVKFKGARMVVVSASAQKKQSGWNRLLKGKIIYKIYPAFTTPIIFKPSRGKRVLARVQSGSYHVAPNPMPGVGTATITDIERNIKINVN